MRTDNREHQNMRGSVTVEASFAFPVFFICIWIFFQFFLMMLFEISVTKAVLKTERELCCVGYLYRAEREDNIDDCSFFALMLLYENLSEADRFSLGGVHANCVQDGEKAYFITVHSDFDVRAPFFYRIIIPIDQKYKIGTNIGVYDKSAFADVDDDTPEDGEKYYVTENGKVFHKDRMCRYINVNYSSVEETEIALMRNREGRKYSPCSYCGSERHTGKVFITESGDKYHYSADCRSLKRTVRTVTKEETDGMKPCSLCGGGK